MGLVKIRRKSLLDAGQYCLMDDLPCVNSCLPMMLSLCGNALNQLASTDSRKQKGRPFEDDLHLFHHFWTDNNHAFIGALVKFVKRYDGVEGFPIPLRRQ